MSDEQMRMDQLEAFVNNKIKELDHKDKECAKRHLKYQAKFIKEISELKASSASHTARCNRRKENEYNESQTIFGEIKEMRKVLLEFLGKVPSACVSKSELKDWVQRLSDATDKKLSGEKSHSLKTGLQNVGKRPVKGGDVGSNPTETSKPETSAGSARQTDYFERKSIYLSDLYNDCNIVDCAIKEAFLSYEGNYYCLTHFVEIVQDDRCSKEDLKWLMNHDNRTRSRYPKVRQMKERYGIE